MKFGFKSGRVLKITTSFFSAGYFGDNQHYFYLSKAYLPLYRFSLTFGEFFLKENTITIKAYS